jgi:hypothetical protein
MKHYFKKLHKSQTAGAKLARFHHRDPTQAKCTTSLKWAVHGYRSDYNIAVLRGEAAWRGIFSLGIGMGHGGRSTKKIDHETRVVKYRWMYGEQTSEFYHF